MSDDEKKQSNEASVPSPPAPSAQRQQGNLPAPAKNPLISRRAFLAGAFGASTLLAIGAFAPPSLPSWNILNPLIPQREGPTQVTTWNDLDSKYQDAVAAGNLYAPSNYSEFFYFPYPVTDSPYYKNVISRLPEPLVNPYYPNDDVLKHVVAFNLTCVHLRCIVNPGYGSGEFRLLCPCHGSQYRLMDAVPVAGPAYDLGLLPLPRVKLSYDSNTGYITATDLDGEAGIGRTD